jgi:hypothetical protein
VKIEVAQSEVKAPLDVYGAAMLIDSGNAVAQQPVPESKRSTAAAGHGEHKASSVPQDRTAAPVAMEQSSNLPAASPMLLSNNSGTQTVISNSSAPPGGSSAAVGPAGPAQISPMQISGNAGAGVVHRAESSAAAPVAPPNSANSAVPPAPAPAAAQSQAAKPDKKRKSTSSKESGPGRPKKRRTEQEKNADAANSKKSSAARARDALEELKGLQAALVKDPKSQPEVQFGGQFLASQRAAYLRHREAMTAAWGQEMTENPITDVCGFCPAGNSLPAAAHCQSLCSVAAKDMEPDAKGGRDRFFIVTELGHHTNYWVHVKTHVGGDVIQKRYKQFSNDAKIDEKQYPLAATPITAPKFCERVRVVPRPEDRYEAATPQAIASFLERFDGKKGADNNASVVPVKRKHRKRVVFKPPTGRVKVLDDPVL